MIARLRGRRLPVERSMDSSSTSAASATWLPRPPPCSAAPRTGARSRSRRISTSARMRCSSTASPTPAERELFTQLLTVTGIGPKVALAVVSGSPAADLRRAIALGDHARFQAIPGIGKKTAERIVLELKEKVGPRSGSRRLARCGTSSHLVARDALVELGYSVVEAEQALADGRPGAADGGADPARRCEGRPHERPVPRTHAAAGGRRGRALAAPSPARRLRRPGGREGAACDRARRRQGTRRGARPRAPRRPARAREDHARADRPRGARSRNPHHRRAGARAQGRHGRDPHRPRAARRAVRRRDPSRSTGRSRRSSTRRSRTSGSTSSSGRGRRRGR